MIKWANWCEVLSTSPVVYYVPTTQVVTSVSSGWGDDILKVQIKKK